jgi:hypothetical protein
MCESCIDVPAYRKHTEESMRELFAREELSTISEDRPLVGACSRRRPDFVFDYGHGLLIVENDEHQHRREPCDCEVARMFQLYMDGGGIPVAFIRFNPHSYVGADRLSGNMHDLARRHVNLIEAIDYIRRDPATFFERHPKLSVTYMYYDGFNGHIEYTDIDPYEQ